jgi:PGM1 C-terminal domain
LLHSLVPGHYDAVTGNWSAEDGSARCYRSTDSLVDPAWRGRTADDVIDAVRSAGLEFDPRTGFGAVLHMFVGLDIDGRIGLTAIGESPGHADRLHRAAAAAIETSRGRRRV